jgi:hypothetical protein
VVFVFVPVFEEGTKAWILLMSKEGAFNEKDDGAAY